MNKMIQDKSEIEPKQIFIQNIQKWVTIDSQIKLLNEKMKQMRDYKNKLTENICKYTKDNNINQTIEISNGELKIYEKKEYSTLTYSYLEECLEKIIQNRDQIQYILQYIKDNREMEINYDIRRTIRK
jgi:hypothetical protein